jgi:hypothetical protein
MCGGSAVSGEPRLSKLDLPEVLPRFGHGLATSCEFLR